MKSKACFRKQLSSFLKDLSYNVKRKPRDVFDAIETLNDDHLLRYLHEEIQMKGNHKKIFMLHEKFTTLHYAIYYQKSESVILKIIEIGGNELVMMKRPNFDPNYNVLHRVYNPWMSTPTVKVIEKIVEIGGRDLITTKCNHKTPLTYGYFDRFSCSQFDDRFEFIMKESILAQVGGEFGIGGLFNIAVSYGEEWTLRDFFAPYSQDEWNLQNRIVQRWKEFAPVLETIFASLEQQPPILHAAIIFRVPHHIITDIIQRFDCLWIKDSLNRNAIDVAVEEGLGWDDEIKNMIETAAAARPCSFIYEASRHGLKWRSHMQEVVNSNLIEAVSGHDALTGLRMFMLAATGDGSSDLSSIYGMMRMSPEINDE